MRKQPTSNPQTSTSLPLPQYQPPPSRSSGVRPRCPTTPRVTHTKINPQLGRRPSNTPQHIPLQIAHLSFQGTALQLKLRNKQTQQASLPDRLGTTPRTRKSPHAPPKPHTQGLQPQLTPKLQSRVRGWMLLLRDQTQGPKLIKTLNKS